MGVVYGPLMCYRLPYVNLHITMASSSPHPSLYTKPSVDLWTKWLGPLIDWQNFAVFLPKIELSDIKKIEEDTTGVDNRKRALWSKWSAVYPNGTWNDVIKALKTIRENALAAEIERELSKEKGKGIDYRYSILRWYHQQCKIFRGCIFHNFHQIVLS